MRLSIQRQPSTQGATLGSLYINGTWRYWTLEDVVLEIPGEPVESWKVQNQTAIPAGTYKVTVDFSNRFQRNMLHILDVPGFEGIRIPVVEAALAVGEDVTIEILAARSFQAPVWICWNSLVFLSDPLVLSAAHNRL